MGNVRTIIKEEIDKFFNDLLESNFIEPDLFIKQLWGCKFKYYNDDDIIYKLTGVSGNESTVNVNWYMDDIFCEVDFSTEDAMESILEGSWLVMNPKTGEMVDFSYFK